MEISGAPAGRSALCWGIQPHIGLTGPEGSLVEVCSGVGEREEGPGHGGLEHFSEPSISLASADPWGQEDLRASVKVEGESGHTGHHGNVLGGGQVFPGPGEKCRGWRL